MRRTDIIHEREVLSVCKTKTYATMEYSNAYLVNVAERERK
jgi:hypothetical protein